MPIELVRIDDRLVHGQIVQGWLKSIDIDKIVVASDMVAGDSMQQMLMAMAVPSSISFEAKEVKDVAKAIVNKEYEKNKVMILASTPADILSLLENNADIKSLNIGGMHFVNGKRQLLRNLSVDDEDVKNLYKISQYGIEIEGRVLPDDERINIVPIIEKEYKEKVAKGKNE